MNLFGSGKKKTLPYRLYDQNGQGLALHDLLPQAAQADVLLFGELHDNEVVHRLQQEMASELAELTNDHLLLGAEMFEADNQLVLDEYLAGLIKHDHLVREAKVWPNYERDYRPLVEVAKARRLSFIATNIPRRYANLVARKGLGALERLSDEARKWMAPLPIEVSLATPGYAEMMKMGTGHGMHMKPVDFVAAQAVKDATMAHFILSHKEPGRLFIHFNGDFHSRQYGGVYWYLKKADPDLRVMTLSSVESAGLEFHRSCRGAADFVLTVAGG